MAPVRAKPPNKTGGFFCEVNMATEKTIEDEAPDSADLSALGTETADAALDQVGQDDLVAEQAPTEVAEAAPEVAPAPITESPAPVAPPVPQAQAIDQQRLADIAQREADLQYRETMTNLDGQVAQYETETSNKYLATGLYTQEQAQMMARQNAEVQKQAFMTQMQTQTQQQQQSAVQQGQFKAALHYAKQYGVDAEDLLQYQTPKAMETAAKSTSRITDLESRLVKQERDAVPSQDMANSTPALAAVGTYENDLARYISGDRDAAAAEAGRISTVG